MGLIISLLLFSSGAYLYGDGNKNNNVDNKKLGVVFIILGIIGAIASFLPVFMINF